MKLSWQVHDGNPKLCIVERREDSGAGRGSWKRIGQVAASVTEYNDSQVNNGEQVSRVRATNDDGDSASSNVVRLKTGE